jgi:hypothetical protein
MQRTPNRKSQRVVIAKKNLVTVGRKSSKGIDMNKKLRKVKASSVPVIIFIIVLMLELG